MDTNEKKEYGNHKICFTDTEANGETFKGEVSYQKFLNLIEICQKNSPYPFKDKKGWSNNFSMLAVYDEFILRQKLAKETENIKVQNKELTAKLSNFNNEFTKMQMQKDKENKALMFRISELNEKLEKSQSIDFENGADFPAQSAETPKTGANDKKQGADNDNIGADNETGETFASFVFTKKNISVAIVVLIVCLWLSISLLIPNNDKKTVKTEKTITSTSVKSKLVDDSEVEKTFKKILNNK